MQLRHMGISWHVHACRRQLLERVGGIWQCPQLKRSGRSNTDAVKVVETILDALTREKACL